MDEKLQSKFRELTRASPDERRAWLIDWAASLRPELLDIAHSIGDKHLNNEIIYLKMLNSGFELPYAYIATVKYWIGTLPDLVGVKIRAKRTVEDNPNMVAFDEALLQLSEGRKTTLHFDPKHSIEEVRVYCLAQVESKDYTPAQLAWFNKVLKDLEVVPVKGSRKKQMRSPVVQSIKRIKWSQTDPEHGLDSNSSPLKAIGAKTLFIWDGKYRRLMLIESKTGLKFEGVSITSVDSSLYVTVRKPEKVMRNGLTVCDLRAIFMKMKSHPCTFQRSQERFVYLASV